MRKTAILLIALTISTFVMAQEEKVIPVKEFGLTFRNLDEFGFSYRTGTNKSLWRFNFVNLNGDNISRTNEDENKDNDSNQLGFGLSIGKEYRKLITKNLEYRYGFDLSFGYHHSKRTAPSYSEYSSELGIQVNKMTYYTPGINMVLGVNYLLGEHLVLGAEIMPHLTYTFGETSEEMEGHYDEEKTDHSNFSYGFNTSSVSLSLAYRF